MEKVSHISGKGGLSETKSAEREDQREGQFGPQKDKNHFMKSGTMSDAIPAERVKYVSNKRQYTCSQSRIQ